MYFFKAISAFLFAAAGLDDSSPQPFDVTIVPRPTTPVKLINVARNASMWTFGGLEKHEVYVGPEPNDGSSVWNMIDYGQGKFAFTNEGNKSALVVDPSTQQLITRWYFRLEPAVFVLRPVGNGQMAIELPLIPPTDAEVISDPYGSPYSTVSMRPPRTPRDSNSTTQYWNVVPQ